MTTAANLLARKQQLLDRLQENPEPSEREEYERVLAKIEIALNYLDKARTGRSRPLRVYAALGLTRCRVL